MSLKKLQKEAKEKDIPFHGESKDGLRWNILRWDIYMKYHLPSHSTLPTLRSSCRSQVYCKSIIGGRQENQDAYCIYQDMNVNGEVYAIYGVFDGHGKCGKVAANTISSYLPLELVQALYNGATLYTSIEIAFLCSQVKLLLHAYPSGIDYGTTASIVVIDKESITMAHVGDSRIVLYTSTPSLHIHASSIDHTPQLPEERRRIESKGGIVYEYKEGNSRMKASPRFLRAYQVMGEKMDFAMSRSLGHILLSTIGISPIPDISTYPISSTSLLIIASDGLWETLTIDEINQCVDNTRIKGLALVLLGKCEEAAKEREVALDNTTILCHSLV